MELPQSPLYPRFVGSLSVFGMLSSFSPLLITAFFRGQQSRQERSGFGFYFLH